MKERREKRREIKNKKGEKDPAKHLKTKKSGEEKIKEWLKHNQLI